MALDETITAVAAAGGFDISALTSSAERTSIELERFRTSLDESVDESHEHVAVILTGSFARAEISDESDCDYLVLVHHVDDHRMVPAMVKETQHLVEELGYAEPGREGVFGDFAIVPELVARIGLDSDSNANLTRRMLLLFESVAVHGDGTRTDAIDLLLDRYCFDYHPDIRTKGEPPWTARFLLNDLTRFWRTMTVDFGAKQWRAVRRDWYLRYAKLLTTRKILFAGCLVSLFTIRQSTRGRGGAEAYTALLRHLKEQIELSPLARLMGIYNDVEDEGRAALEQILASYEDFMQLASDPDTRDAIKRAGNLETPDDHRIQDDIEELGGRIQRGLEDLLFKDPLLADMTPKYGLF